MFAKSRKRVADNSSDAANRRIRDETERRVAYYAVHPEEIEHRLDELEREWDIERAIEANASTLALAGLALGATVDRRWLALPALVAGFLFQHSLQGWCPPVPVLRSLGFRTAAEIEEERYALKALRGDFAELGNSDNKAAAALRAVNGRYH